MNAVIPAILQAWLSAEDAVAPAVTSTATTAAAYVPPYPSVFDMVFPLTMLLILGLVVPAALLGLNTILSRFAHGTRNTNPAKHEPYESGLPSVIGFLVVFLVLLEVGYLYLYKKGALDWDK